MFTQEPLLYLLAPRRQRGRNPYEELKRVIRDNEMIPREQAVPIIESPA